MSALTIADLEEGKMMMDFNKKFTLSLNPRETDPLGRNRRTLQGIDDEATERLDDFSTTAAGLLATQEAAAEEQRADIEASADLVLAQAGYAPPVLYAAGLSMTVRTQTVDFAGVTYAPKPSVLPFITGADFDPGKWRLIQGISAPDLATANGVKMVGVQEAGGDLLSIWFHIKKLPVNVRNMRSSAGEGGDDTWALNEMVDCGKIEKREMVVEPAGSGGYNTSTGILLNFDNARLTLKDSIRYTSTVPGCAIKAIGTASAPGAELKGLRIVGAPGVKVDGNAWNILGYDYKIEHPAKNSFYGAVFIQWCEDPYVSDFRAINGLVGGFVAYQCRRGTVERVRGSHSRFDNGVGVNFDPEGFDPYDADTWSSFVMRDVIGDYNVGFGVTSYGATNVQALGLTLVYCNGNNDPVVNPGPGGGLSAELNGPHQRDYHFYCERLMSMKNYGRGAFLTASGSVIAKGKIDKTLVPPAWDVYPGVNPNVLGSGVASFGAKDVDINLDIRNSGRNGILVQHTTGRSVGMRVRGSVSGSAARGLSAAGFDLIDVNAKFDGNGLEVGGAFGVDAVAVDNTTFNTGAGVARIGGSMTGNGGSAARVVAAGEAYVAGLSGRNNNANHTPQSAVFVDACVYADVRDVDHRGPNVTSIVTIGGGTARARDPVGVTGDYTVQRVSNAATLKSGSSRSRNSYVFGNSVGYTTPAAPDLLVVVDDVLTAPRVINLNMTNPTQFDCVEVSRSAAATGSTLTVTDGVQSYPVVAGTALVIERAANAWRVRPR